MTGPARQLSGSRSHICAKHGMAANMPKAPLFKVRFEPCAETSIDHTCTCTPRSVQLTSFTGRLRRKRADAIVKPSASDLRRILLVFRTFRIDGCQVLTSRCCFPWIAPGAESIALWTGRRVV